MGKNKIILREANSYFSFASEIKNLKDINIKKKLDAISSD